jgi:hypothetical protein
VKLALTLMVRDEADIVSSMLDHHLAQGVDTIIVTDNGSIDGTTDILRDYEARGLIELRHDPRHLKQQSPVVTQMARDAHTVHGADWVINADADEFFLPVDRTLTLHDVFERMSKDLQAFLVPVTNLTGPAAQEGTGLQRLVYRDLRSDDQLAAAGLRAHPTPDAVHIGHPDIEVIQGNHLVSLASNGTPPPELAIEVLHLPWRSYAQYRHKVDVSGRAYESNPDLTPSPNHHGMRDFARLKSGALEDYYLLRHPSDDELQQGLRTGQFAPENVLAERLPSAVADVPFTPESITLHERVAPALRDSEARIWQLTESLKAKEVELSGTQHELDAASERITELEGRVQHLLQVETLTNDHVATLEERMRDVNARWEVRVSNRLRRDRSRVSG